MKYILAIDGPGDDDIKRVFWVYRNKEEQALMRHREDGPAVEGKGYMQYYLFGKPMNPYAYIIALHTLKRLSEK